MGGSSGIALTAPTGTVFPTYFFDFDSEYTITDLTNSSGSGLAQASTSNDGATASIVPSNDIQPGDSITLTITGVTNPQTSGSVTLSTSSDLTPASVAATFAPGATVSGEVTAGTAAEAGALIQICNTSSGGCDQLTSDSNGDFSALLGDGSYEFTATPPTSGTAYGQSSEGPVAVTGTSPETVNLALLPPTPLPTGVSLSSSDFGTESGDVPTLNWGDQSTLTVKGCPYGAGWASIMGTNTQTGGFAADFVPLEGSPQARATTSREIPPQYPVHGSTQLSYSITCVPMTYVLPYAGPTTGGTTTTVYGTGFTGTTEVLFGDTPAPSFQVVSGSEISAVTPAGEGKVPVSVKNAQGQLSSPVGSYDYLSISQIAPLLGSPAGGGKVTIDGNGFSSAVGVEFGKTLASSFTVDSDTEITATVPPGTGSVGVSVITTGGSSVISGSSTYTYSTSGAAAGSRSPGASGPIPKFNTKQTWRLPSAGGINAGVVVAVVAGGIGAVNGGTTSINTGTSVQSNDNSTISGASSSLQTALTNSGNMAVGLTSDGIEGWVIGQADLALGVGGGPIALTALSASALEAAIEQLNQALEREQEAADRYDDALRQALQKADQDAAARGQKWDPANRNWVPCKGSCNSGSSSVLVDPSGTVTDTNGNPISGASAELLRLSAPGGLYTAPPSGSALMQPSVNPETTRSSGEFHWDVYPGIYEVQASKQGCTKPGDRSIDSVTSRGYQVPPPALGISLVLQCRDEPAVPRPTVSSLSESQGMASGGYSVVITGKGFTDRSTADFGNKKARRTVYLSPTTVEATVPSGGGTVDVTVLNGSKRSPSKDATFTYVDAPSVDAVSPDSGPRKGGTTVVITGDNLSGVNLVMFGSIPASSFRVLSPVKILAVAPTGEGKIHIAVTSVGGSSQSTAGTYQYVRDG